MKRFAYILPKKFKIAAWVVIAVWSIMIFYTLSRLFNLFGLSPTNLTLEYVTLGLSLLLIVFMIGSLNVAYVVDTKKLRLDFLFLDINRGKILIDKIAQIVLDKKHDRLYVVSDTGEDEPRIMLIAIKPSSYDNFTARLRELNPKIIYTESESG